MQYYFYRTEFSIMAGKQMKMGLIEARETTAMCLDEQGQGNGGKIVS